MVMKITKEDLLTMPKDAYMNDIQLGYFRDILEQQKSDILSDFESVKDSMVATGYNADMSDVATQHELQQLDLKRADRERKLLSKIDSTLRLINSGDYGYCEETGDKIGLKRMLARPTATLSIVAKERQEYRERTIGMSKPYSNEGD
jgi:DnaK suppressor protein